MNEYFDIEQNLGKAALAKINKVTTGATPVYDPRLIPITDALDNRVSDNEADILTLQTDVGSHRLHGVISGMNVTKNANERYFDISSGVYYINGTRMSYQGSTLNDTSSVADGQYGSVTIDVSGAITVHPVSFPSYIELDDELELTAFSKKTTGNEIDDIGDSFFDGLNFIKKIYMRNKLFAKTIFNNGAGQISANVTNPLQLDIAHGFINTPNSDIKEILSETNIVGRVNYRVAGVYVLQPKGILTINNSQYDNGDLTTLSNNKFVVHTISRSSRTETIYLTIGNTQYLKIEDAIEADYNLGIFTGEEGGEIEPLANIVIEKGSPTIGAIIDLRGGVKVTTTSLSSAFDSRLTVLENQINAIATATGITFNPDGTLLVDGYNAHTHNETGSVTGGVN